MVDFKLQRALDLLVFAIKVTDSFDISFQDSLYLKLSGDASFILLLDDDIAYLDLEMNLGFLVKSMSFKSGTLVIEGTKTELPTLVLSTLTFPHLSKLCVILCLLEKVGESISYYPVEIQFPRHIRWKLMRKPGSKKLFVWDPTSFAKFLKHCWI